MLRIECLPPREYLLGVNFGAHLPRLSVKCWNVTPGRELDDFVFDNQILAQAVAFGYRIGELVADSIFP